MPTGILAYVVGAIVALAALIGAHEVGHARGLKVGRAELAAYQAQAEAESEKLRARAAKVETKVVIQYRDRVQKIRVPETVEVVREIEVIRQSGCVLPPEFRLLHDGATGSSSEATGGANDSAAPVDCATAIEVIRENYRRARENAAQLEALQEWAESVSQ
jgi:hypothetical protein